MLLVAEKWRYHVNYVGISSGVHCFNMATFSSFLRRYTMYDTSTTLSFLWYYLQLSQRNQTRDNLSCPFSWPMVLNCKWACRPFFRGLGQLCEWLAVADLMLVVREIGEGQATIGQPGTSNLLQRVCSHIDGAVMTITMKVDSLHSVMVTWYMASMQCSSRNSSSFRKLFFNTVQTDGPWEIM